jgi:hypothetical protein
MTGSYLGLSYLYADRTAVTVASVVDDNSTHQYTPAVSATSDGGFIVSWTLSSNIYAQRFAVNNVLLAQCST